MTGLVFAAALAALCLVAVLGIIADVIERDRRRADERDRARMRRAIDRYDDRPGR